ncbi:hypothetical protein QTJ16_006973 [Diplocarpon rosae]|uniref:Amino acid transporter n=1 Tax=Diplocarpon rosae TaxID=946125 RepID=A0AAD9W9V7_9HELO|nr:hypothetical protein QTJ16_006973 [Diplocarpon rosae]
MDAVEKGVVGDRSSHLTPILQKTRSGNQGIIDHAAGSDEEVLTTLGFKQEFKRDLSIWSSFSVSFSVLGLLPSIASTLGYNLAYSGPAGSVWGWVVAAVLIQFVALAMAEICSSMPTAGGLYYAAAVLAPGAWGPLLSWITGWSNFVGQVTGPCSVNFALSAMILTAVQMGTPSYVTETFHVYLLLVALLIFQGALTMNSTKFIGRLNLIGSVTNLIVLFMFIIWMPLGSINHSKTNPNSEVWTSKGIFSGTEWPTGLAFLMGFLSVIGTMSGYDAPFHLSEECSNANIASPRAIVMTAQLGLYLGWAIILVIAYTVKDVPDVVAGQYGQPMGSLCLQVLGPQAGLAMFSLNIFAQFFVGQGCTVASSRVVYAYSRDGALPGSRWLKQVNSQTRTPVNAVCPIAIGAVFSIGAIAQYTAFAIPIALKLLVVGDKFRPGPWHLGRFSKPVGAITCCWVALIIPVLCFPSVRGSELTKITANYTCLIYGGVMSLALIWYAIDARKWFKGPKINIENMIQVNVWGDQDESVEQVEEKSVENI